MYLLSLRHNSTALRGQIFPMKLGAIELARVISIVNVNGRVLGRDPDKIMTQLAQDVANCEHSKDPRVVEESEFLLQLLEHDEADADRLGSILEWNAAERASGYNCCQLGWQFILILIFYCRAQYILIAPELNWFCDNCVYLKQQQLSQR